MNASTNDSARTDADESSIGFLLQPGGCLQGSVRVPGDKSISHRAIMLGALADGVTEVTGFLEGADALATLAAFRAMGVEIQGPDKGRVLIKGVGMQGLRAPDGPLDMGNSGTSMRLLSGLLSGQSFETTLIGDSSLSRRPMRRVTEPLARMGARIDTTDGGMAPLRISPNTALQGIDYVLPVASAQVKSCLLLAGLYAEGETCISEPAVTRDHTERMLLSLGYALERSPGRVCLRGGGRLTAAPIAVPADISSAAFFLVGASIAPGSDLLLEAVGTNPTRIGILNILQAMGADIQLENQRDLGAESVADIRVRSAPLKGLHIPEDQVPLAIDEFPALFIAAACAEGETVLTGAEELRVKESDRIGVMAEGLKALGIKVEARPDGIRIQGRGGRTTDEGAASDQSTVLPIFSSGRVESHGDHRIAMSFAIAALRAAGPIEITDCANVGTSFPGFSALAASAGLSITETGRSEDTAPVITIDGPSGSGKGTIAERLAQAVGWHVLDSGALYRALGLAAERAGLDLDDGVAVGALAGHISLRFEGAAVLLDGEDVTTEIRTAAAGPRASRVAVHPEVRAALLDWQRAAARSPGLIADGRDMGSTVFPNAGLKIYLDASPEERAERRYKQLKDKGLDANLADLVRELRERDDQDRRREHSPLVVPEGAVVIDTTSMPIDQVLSRVIAETRARWPA